MHGAGAPPTAAAFARSALLGLGVAVQPTAPGGSRAHPRPTPNPRNVQTQGAPGYVFTEADWSVESAVSGYVKSKLLAERAAWAAVQGTATELATVCPSLVLGPLTSARDCSSAEVVQKLFDGSTPLLPDIELQICDMRDVVAAHVAALEAPGAAGRRFLVHSGSPGFRDVAKLLASTFGPRGYRVSTGRAPYALLWLASLFSPAARGVLPMVGARTDFSAARAEGELGVKVHTWQEAVLAAAESLAAFGALPKR